MASPSTVNFTIKYDEIPHFAEAITAAPTQLAREFGKAFYRIGKSDIDRLKREQLSGGGRLHVRFKGLLNAFKFRAADSRKIENINELWLSEWVGWKAAQIFQTGGTIVPRKARVLTIITEGGRNAAGKRLWTQKELRAKIASGEIQIIPTPKGPMLVRGRIKTTKKGKIARGSRYDIIGFLRPRTRQQKRLDWYENFDRNKLSHDSLLAEAVDNVFEKIKAGTKQ